MKFDILTIFPKIFDSYFNESLFARAKKNRILSINIHNLRDYTTDKHHKVDDIPYGGGPGMVLKVEPIYKAVKKLNVKSKNPSFAKATKGKEKSRVILFSTRGKKLDSKIAKRLSKYDRLILICGRYEGVDERVAENIADEEISIGDYVLSGGEIPAMVLVEAVSRFIPKFLGKYESLEDVKGYYKAFTRPEVFNKWKVPRVLLSGNHKEIEEWREKN